MKSQRLLVKIEVIKILIDAPKAPYRGINNRTKVALTTILAAVNVIITLGERNFVTKGRNMDFNESIIIPVITQFQSGEAFSSKPG